MGDFSATPRLGARERPIDHSWNRPDGSETRGYTIQSHSSNHVAGSRDVISFVGREIGCGHAVRVGSDGAAADGALTLPTRTDVRIYLANDGTFIATLDLVPAQLHVGDESDDGPIWVSFVGAHPSLYDVMTWLVRIHQTDPVVIHSGALMSALEEALIGVE